ncbi:MAG TPA: hypothetical protein VFJ02_23945 [Vicinamibacterales bacterium]|nr:hypothetical protein [Vicinamibacterales bacterium]
MDRAGIVRVGILAVASLAAGTSASDAQAGAPSPAIAKTANAQLTTGWIIGTAWKGDTTPFAQARIRLRNVQNGRGVATTVSDGEGRFRFDRIDPAAYVVELLANDDRVLAVGDLFGVNVGMQSVTVVRLTAKTPWHGGFWGNAAAAAIAAASTLGVTANGTNGRPVSPQ